MAFIIFVKLFALLVISLLYSSLSSATSVAAPILIDSLSVINQTVVYENDAKYIKLVAQLRGKNLHVNMEIKPTSQVANFGQECVDRSFFPAEIIGGKFDILWANNSVSVVTATLKFNGDNKNNYNVLKNIYLCTSDHERTRYYNNEKSMYADDGVIKWYHQGSRVIISLSDDDNSDGYTNSINHVRLKRDDFSKSNDTTDGQKKNAPTSSPPSVILSDSASAADNSVNLHGFRIDYSSPKAMFDDSDTDGIPELLVGSEVWFRLFGSGWNNHTMLGLTEESFNKGDSCETIVEKTTITIDPLREYIAHMNITIPKPSGGKRSTTFYFCAKNNNQFVHLGLEKSLQLAVRERIIPVWSQIVIIVFCLVFSCLFSGLNLGLLSLNQTDLKIISNTGTDAERRYAKTIYPIRLDGNYLLCSILFGNVLVNSTFTILLDDLVSGTLAIIISTLAIVIMGEIVPQAVCSRHGLAIGAKTILITKTVMILTMPLSWPISRALDWCLGQEITNIYTRERLKELVNVTREYNDLEKEEVNIISGALELRKKTVAEVMTRIEDVYMLSLDTVLDFETVSEIMKSGYSRIPIYETHRHNIVSLLYIKDLALIDPDDNTPVKTLSKFYQNSIYFVFEDTTLDVVFKQFKEGCKGHMAFVNRVNSEGSGDPFYETIGIVTLEDVIEELIQAEIMDETDVYTDNRNKQRRAERNLRSHQDFSVFAERSENQKIHISPQLNLAAFQFLSSSVDAFKSENISEPVLLRLLKQDVIFVIKMKDKDKSKDDPTTLIYQQSKPSDYFVLILEGRVEVIVGRENLVFESGPFTYFGSQALMQNIGVAESPTSASQLQPLGSLQSVNIESMLRYTFIPDYTVHAVTQVLYLRIKRSVYLAAKKATLMERSKKVSNAGDQFDNEVEKILHPYGKGGSVEEDTKSQVSREGSYSNAQVSSFIEDSNRSTPLNQDQLNNGGISSTVSPSRTPRSNSDHVVGGEEKVTLLGSNALPEDRVS